MQLGSIRGSQSRKQVILAFLHHLLLSLETFEGEW
jgi:hypothetical protein